MRTPMITAGIPSRMNLILQLDHHRIVEMTYSHCQPYRFALPERNPTPVAMRPPKALTISMQL
jgi:hypothetical protein